MCISYLLTKSRLGLTRKCRDRGTRFETMYTLLLRMVSSLSAWQGKGGTELNAAYRLTRAPMHRWHGHGSEAQGEKRSREQGRHAHQAIFYIVA